MIEGEFSNQLCEPEMVLYRDGQFRMGFVAYILQVLCYL